MSKEQRDPVIESAHRAVASLTEVEEEMRGIVRSPESTREQVAAAGATWVSAVMGKHHINMSMMQYTSMMNMASDGRHGLLIPTVG